jgi:hypothetical protein
MPPAREILYEFDQYAESDGWHIYQNFGLYTFRWTAAARFTLTLPLIGDGPAAITFRISEQALEGYREQVRLSVNGTPIPLTQADDVFSGMIPLSAIGPAPYSSITLTFDGPLPVRPADLEPRKREVRLVGVAFDWLRVGRSVPTLP